MELYKNTRAFRSAGGLLAPATLAHEETIENKKNVSEADRGPWFQVQTGDMQINAKSSMPQEN